MMAAVSMENYNYITFDTALEKIKLTGIQYGGITISVLTRDKIKINGNQSGKLQHQY